MSGDEARSSPQRHAVLQAIGAEGDVSPSVREEVVCAGDVYVLCSDGVHDLIEMDGRDSSTVVIAAPDAASGA